MTNATETPRTHSTEARFLSALMAEPDGQLTVSREQVGDIVKMAAAHHSFVELDGKRYTVAAMGTDYAADLALSAARRRMP